MAITPFYILNQYRMYKPKGLFFFYGNNMPLTDVSVRADDADEVYSAILETIQMNGFKRPQVIAGLLMMLAVQIAGRMPTEDELAKFTYDACGFAVMYFSPTQSKATN